MPETPDAFVLCPECTEEIQVPGDADDDDQIECLHCGAVASAYLLRMDLEEE